MSDQVDEGRSEAGFTVLDPTQSERRQKGQRLIAWTKLGRLGFASDQYLQCFSSPSLTADVGVCFWVCQGVLKETNSHSGHSEFRHVHTVVPEHPLHAVQVCPVSREAFLEIIPIGEIQEFLFDSPHPSRNMEPIQTILTFLPKPGAYHSSQSVFAIRQDPQIRVLSSTAAA